MNPVEDSPIGDGVGVVSHAGNRAIEGLKARSDTLTSIVSTDSTTSQTVKVMYDTALQAAQVRSFANTNKRHSQIHKWVKHIYLLLSLL